MDAEILSERPLLHTKENNVFRFWELDFVKSFAISSRIIKRMKTNYVLLVIFTEFFSFYICYKNSIGDKEMDYG